MSAFPRLLLAEGLKLRRSGALRLVWILPLFFLVLDWFLVSKNLKSQAHPSAAWLSAQPAASVQAYWAGFFHILLVALMPALVFRPEHRSVAWKHLDALPPSPRSVYLAKGLMLLLLIAACLALCALGLRAEWAIRLSTGMAAGAFRFPWYDLFRVMGWMYLGSLPLLALYLWLGQRISSGAVPIAFALIGLLLTIALSGNELDPSWRRDLIPWVLPYVSAQEALDKTRKKQEAHIAERPFQREVDLNPLTGTEVYYLPSGRKVTSTTTIDPYFLMPPPPTPKRVLAAFSLICGAALTLLGLLGSRRSRARAT